MKTINTGNIAGKSAYNQPEASAASNPMQLLLQKKNTGNPFAPLTHKPAFNPLQRQFVVQRKVTAGSFKQFLADQHKLTEEMQHPEQLRQKYTTAGFECEFISMLDGDLQNFTHHEIAKTEGMFIKQLPFILETDAGAALEFVTPPFLVETVPDRPIPLASDLVKIDNLMKTQLSQFTTGNTSVGKLVADFNTIGINFHLEDSTAKVNSFADMQHQSKLTQNSPEIKKEEVEKIKLGKGNKHGGGMSSQVNFATDADTYRELLEPTGRSVKNAIYFNNVEAQLKEILSKHGGSGTPGIQFFSNEFARSISGLISTPYAQASIAHKEAGFARQEADPADTMNIEFNVARNMASVVKDTKNVWIKDTLMNIVASSMTEEDLKHAFALLTNEAFISDIGQLKIPIVGKSSETAGIQKTTILNIKSAVAELIKQVQIKQQHFNENIDFAKGKKVGFMGHDPELIGARQDTYISQSNTGLPQWPDKRLHVVESRGDIEDVTDKLGLNYEPGYHSFAERMWQDNLESIPDFELAFMMKTQLFKDLDLERANAYTDKVATKKIITRFDNSKALMLSTGKINYIEQQLAIVKTSNNDSGIATIEDAIAKAKRANNDTMNNVHINKIKKTAEERLDIRLASWRLSSAENEFYQAMNKL